MDAASGWLDGDEGAEGLLRCLGGALGYECGRIWMGADEGWLRAGARWVAAPAPRSLPEVLRTPRSPMTSILLAEPAWRESRPRAMGALPRGAGFGRMRSTLVVPVRADDAVYGILALYAQRVFVPRDAELTRLAAVAESVGQALLEREPALDAHLSPREIEVLQLASEGQTNREIGDRLSVSAATVKTHLAHIFEKLDASDRAGAVAAALRGGILS